MRIGVKLLAGFSALGLFAGIIGFLEYREAERIHEEFAALRSHVIPVMRSLDRIRASGKSVMASTSEVALLRALGSRESVGGQIAKEMDELSGARAELEAVFAEYASLVERYFPKERQIRATLQSALEELVASSDALLAGSLHLESGALLDQTAALEEAEAAFVEIVMLSEKRFRWLRRRVLGRICLLTKRK